MFIFVLPISDNHLFHDVTEAPWTTSQVSQKWRSICLFSPQLWSQFNVRDRYGSVALKIRLENVSTEAEKICERLLWPLRALFAWHPRDYITNSSALAQRAGDTLAGKESSGLPALRTLSLGVRPKEDCEEGVKIIRFFARSPNLTSVTFKFFHGPFSDIVGIQRYSWRQIRFFQGDACPREVVGVIVPQLQKATMLKLQWWWVVRAVFTATAR
ncbi:hypothetical protein BDV98DRAFT_568814 [Pterulicium gracile]|uniref:F-box domain-containing protein n=1 Tax=Pterulicium gracile TaxID=1884261 RepID=A0A5C3QH92_9AGAR|nr:hypothetical protein BDV98DRAFT_568814 [Pterula gracilis]